MIPSWLLLHTALSPTNWGWISLVLWVVSSAPQVIENHQRQTSLPLPFVVLWTAGDGSNVACTLFTHQKLVVVLLAVYCFTADCVLYVQYLMYGVRPRLSRQRLALWGSVPALCLLLVLNFGSTFLLSIESALGEAACWSSMVFFTVSRLPQIVRGCRGEIDAAEAAKTSRLFMFFLIAANVTYILSVWDEGQLSQTLGSAVATLCDLTVFWQNSRLQRKHDPSLLDLPLKRRQRS